MRIAFCGPANAGPSQMATAFAERKRNRHGYDLEIITGGNDPIEQIHDAVIEAMAEVGIDMSDRTPQRLSPEAITTVDHLITMDSPVDQFRPDDDEWEGTVQTWDLTYIGESDREAIDQQRDLVERRVDDLFERLENEQRIGDATTDTGAG
jgi:arsenate reductase